MGRRSEKNADSIAAEMASWLQALGGFGFGGDPDKRWQQFRQEMERAETGRHPRTGDEVGICPALSAMRLRWIDGNLGLQLGEHRTEALLAVRNAERRHNCGG